jgi:YcxB-like protein
MSMDEITIKYQLTWKEYRRMYSGADPMKSRLFVVLILMVIAITWIALTANHQLLWAIVITIFAAQLVASTFYFSPRRRWRIGIGIQEPTSVTVSDRGIDRKSESLEVKREWTEIAKLRETNEYFILLPSGGTSSIFFPKRGLESSDEEVKLRRILMAHATLIP